MPSAGQTTASTEAVLFSSDVGCTAFSFIVDATSAAPLEINIPGLHDAGEYFKMAAGEFQIFRLNHCGIRKISVRGDGGTATFRYGIVSRTNPSN